MTVQRHRTEVLIIGGGLAGIVAALELIERGHRVLIVDRDMPERFGGLAKDAFGGMTLCGTPQQKFNRIPDNPDLLLRDWLSFAEFSPEDKWPLAWARMYAERNREDIQQWLVDHQVKFFPAVNWVERGEFKPGNSLPRYHLVWGTGWELVRVLTGQLKEHRNAANLTLLFQHRVDELVQQGSAIRGCQGLDERQQQEFIIEADVTIVATGGINGSIEKVRQHWPWPAVPPVILNGSHRYADGKLHDVIAALGGNITHLDWQWNYAAGIRHPKPRLPDHGLSLIPPRSALWLDATGRRIGPHPMITGFDTHGLCERVCQLPQGYTWQVMNRKIARKEISISGSEHNPSFRDRKLLAFIKEILLGNDNLYTYLTTQCEDVVTADSFDELVAKMNALSLGAQIDAEGMLRDIQEYDANLERGKGFHNDDQLRRLDHLRRWKGDRIRNVKNQKILDPTAGPLVAIREFIISRKSMGGIQTDDHSRVLSSAGQPMENLYAVGEAAGFGGGGISGKRSLEGTFLSSCVLTGRIAARSISGMTKP